MLMARWGSDIILRYVSDAPLANISREYMVGTAPTNAAPQITPPAATPGWEQAIKLNANENVDMNRFPNRERFAVNTNTAFAHVIAKRKPWERPVAGRTMCGQDYRGRGYSILSTLPLWQNRGGNEVPILRCNKCAKPPTWQALIDAPEQESDTDSD